MTPMEQLRQAMIGRRVAVVWMSPSFRRLLEEDARGKVAVVRTGSGRALGRIVPHPAHLDNIDGAVLRVDHEIVEGFRVFEDPKAPA